jgi:hypothetical protein
MVPLSSYHREQWRHFATALALSLLCFESALPMLHTPRQDGQVGPITGYSVHLGLNTGGSAVERARKDVVVGTTDIDNLMKELFRPMKTPPPPNGKSNWPGTRHHSHSSNNTLPFSVRYFLIPMQMMAVFGMKESRRYHNVNVERVLGEGDFGCVVHVTFELDSPSEELVLPPGHWATPLVLPPGPKSYPDPIGVGEETQHLNGRRKYHVAVKRVKKTAMVGEKLASEVEAGILRYVSDHVPDAVRYYGDFGLTEHHYTVMELLQGMELEKVNNRIRKELKELGAESQGRRFHDLGIIGAPPLHTTVDISEAVARPIAARMILLFEQLRHRDVRLIHADLKIGNMVLMQNGYAQVGLCESGWRVQQGRQKCIQSITATLTLIPCGCGCDPLGKWVFPQKRIGGRPVCHPLMVEQLQQVDWGVGMIIPEEPEGNDHVMSKHLAATMNPRRCSPELFKELLGKLGEIRAGKIIELVSGCHSQES